MAINGLGNNNADEWQAWTVKVAQNPSSQQESFRINPKGNTDVSLFNKKLEEISDEYIKQYDADGDKKISYDEFEAYEVKQLKANSKDIDDNTLAQAKTKLRNLYNNLNVNNDNDSKDNLDKGEIMNMFHTMDGSNTAILDDNQMHIDGLISKEEYSNFVDAMSQEKLSAKDAKEMIDDIDPYVDGQKNIPEVKKTLIKHNMLTDIMQTYLIQNFAKANYEANFKDFK